MKQMVYASAAVASFEETELDGLLRLSRSSNQSIGITGVLLFRDRTFFQVMEGPADAVDKLFRRISADPRHCNMIVLSEQEIDSRHFGDWQMGFTRDEGVIDLLPGFVDFFAQRDTEGPGSSSSDSCAAGQSPKFIDLKSDSQRMRQILEGFRRGRWRRSEFTEPVLSAN
ncbi:Blue light- and temperature-regulated antirepressor YcgF [Rubripirellula reticaptiva]|uniref:Blue light-and temperature-regulated antirepressor YcgF n=2 Tax=Rubripirellula reticaptiva TaxID=2528013 RepID=A0A5C6EGS2_9BACT|nr:Blue light- and temperature-regulated antirepressor YcgF [Rubripirellula reticaptiva]